MIICTYLLLIVDNEADVGNTMNRRNKKQGGESKAEGQEVQEKKDDKEKKINTSKRRM